MEEHLEVKNLDISIRLEKVLKKARITNLAQIKERTKESIAALPYVSRGQLKELMEIMEEKNISFKDNDV